MSTINNVVFKNMVYDGQMVKKWNHNGVEVFSAGAAVVYNVDTNTSYVEEVDNGASCLSPKTFTPTKSGWTFVGWREDRTASSSVLSSKVMGTEPISLYAVFKKDVTVTYSDMGSTNAKSTKQMYYNNGTTAKPSFTLTQYDSAITERGWSTSNKGDAAITYNNGATFERDSDITLYGLYQQTITLSYAGNGATGGSTASHTGTRYWAPAGYIDPSFTLKANGFTRNGYTFNGWDLGAVGTTITLTENKTATAKWTDNAWTWVNNYVGSGDTLTITITDADNALSLHTGDKLSRFDVASYHDDDLENMSIDFQTNSVNTRGCKYMTITNPDFTMGRNTNGNSADYVRVMSTSSSTPLYEWKVERVYGGTYKIDVSSASQVYIIGVIGAWGQSQSPNARVPAISFSN